MPPAWPAQWAGEVDHGQTVRNRLEGAQWLPAAREQLADAQQRTWLFRGRSDSPTTQDRCHRRAGPGGAKPLCAELAHPTPMAAQGDRAGLPVQSAQAVASRRAAAQPTALASARPGPHPSTPPRRSSGGMPLLQQHAAVEPQLQHAHADGGPVTGAAAQAATSRATPALARSKLELEAPGSFCADMWASVSDGPSSIFRWGGLLHCVGAGGGARPGTICREAGPRRPCVCCMHSVISPANQLLGLTSVMHAVPGTLRRTAALLIAHRTRPALT